MKKGDAVVIVDTQGNTTQTTVTSAGKKWVTADGRRFDAETHRMDVGGCAILSPSEYLLKTHTVVVWRLLYDIFGLRSRPAIPSPVYCRVLQVLVDAEELELPAPVKESLCFLIEHEKQK